jgi:peroxin-2
MFAVPLLPSTPAFLAPSVIIPPIKAFLSQPESIDYTSIPLLPRSNSSDPKISKAHSGPLAHLPMSTCPLCYLRYSSTPQPISATSTGSHIALPPLTIPGERDIVDEEGKEEMSVFVPAQTDCWGCCRWCYYCVAGELATHRQAIKNAAKIVTGEQKKDAEAIVQPWMCLRCGGDVSRAWRVGAEP